MTEHTAAPECGAAPESTTEPPAPAAPAGRRTLFALLRWTAAVLVFGVAGTGVAYGITRLERTDVPGLATEGDGRLTFPPLVKPSLPAGAPLPFAEDNPDGVHYAGLSQLLLPPPDGSTPDAALPLEKDSKVSADTFLEEYEAQSREALRAKLATDGPREIVARGWTTPDGTRTRVYLLRHHSTEFVAAFGGCGAQDKMNGASDLPVDGDWTKAEGSRAVMDNTVVVFKEGAPFGDEQTALGCVRSGDVQAVIVQTRKGEVAAVPFHQTVVLQSRLLG